MRQFILFMVIAVAITGMTSSFVRAQGLAGFQGAAWENPWKSAVSENESLTKNPDPFSLFKVDASMSDLKEFTPEIGSGRTFAIVFCAVCFSIFICAFLYGLAVLGGSASRSHDSWPCSG